MKEVPKQEVTESQESEKQQSPRIQRHEGLPTFFWVLLLIVSIILTASITNYTTTGRLPWEWGANQHALTNRDFRDFQRTYRLLSSDYYGDISHQNLVDQGISGMTDGIDDPYTGFYFDSDNAELQSSIDAKVEGIGATVQEMDGKIIIVSPVKDSPAEKAGLKPNDIVVSVDDKPMENVSAEEAVKRIRGKTGTTVKLVIQRGSETFDVSMKRAEVPIETVHSEIDTQHPDIAHIQITTFSENTADELKHAIESMRQAKAKRFIIDLRGNPGGLLSAALDIANMFLKNGQPIVSVVDKNQNKETYHADSEQYGDFKITEPTVVLVDGGSASASEIVAGALQQSAHIPIVGTQTFGKGTVQSIIPYNAAETRELKVTTGHWMTPNGQWINQKGITPDHPITFENIDQLMAVDTKQTYKAGDTSAAIENIKRLFNQIGLLEENQINQQYDEQLVDVVKAFQKEHHLAVTGKMTSKTAETLMQEVQEWLQTHDKQKQEAIKVLEALSGGNNNG
ncbi:MAG: S41 family peptidase [Aerococcus sp.]|nr:S41 family peptidase [Aerococcus sp.]